MCGRQDLGLSAILSATFYPNGRQNGFVFRWFWRTSSPNRVFLLSDISFGRFLFFGEFAKIDFACNHVRSLHFAIHVDVCINIGRGGKLECPSHMPVIGCMKKKLIALSMAAALAVAMTGCGGSSSTAPSSTETSSESVVSSEAAAKTTGLSGTLKCGFPVKNWAALWRDSTSCIRM